MKEQAILLHDKKLAVQNLKHSANQIEFDYLEQHFCFQLDQLEGDLVQLRQLTEDIDPSFKYRFQKLDSETNRLYKGHHHLEFKTESKQSKSAASKEASPILKADHPGTIIAIHCKVGDQVKAEDELITIESMKLQRKLSTSVSGVVSNISVQQDEVVKSGQELIVIDVEENAS